MKLATVGGILIAGAALSATLLQVTGYGLVTASPATPPLQVTRTGRNLTVTVSSPQFAFHPWRIAPVTGALALGLVCCLIAGKEDRA